MTTETPDPVQTAPDVHPPTVPVDHQYEVAIINEECAEVGQIVGKIFRFGWASQNPDTGRANYDLLHDEMGDVEAAIEFGVTRGAFDRAKINASKKAKLAKLKKVAPPVMRVTSGSTITHQQRTVNESSSAVIVLAIFVAFLIGAFMLGRNTAPKVTEAPAAQVNVEQAAKEAQDCYARVISSIQPGKAAKPADVSACDALAKAANDAAKAK